jgi:3,4-dihydroxy 2-butanone 4-phosphate synthase/GTP cyclohydrolase II
MPTPSAKTSNPFDPIETILDAIRAGELVVVTDDTDRENEGDLVFAADKVTPELVNFMATHGRGLICVPVTEEHADALGLQRMVSQNKESHRTDFTVSVDATHGITTGISAHDRSATIAILADPTARPEQLVQPGHIFPLRAKTGGVLRRAGHTEAAVDLARMAGLNPAGVLCEILNADGTMARLPELLQFKAQHGLKMCSIADLIAYRRATEKLVLREQIIQLPTDYGDFELHLYKSTVDGEHHLALVKGHPEKVEAPLVRVHSECLTGDVFGSRRCDCGSQLHQAMQMVEREGCGIILYMKSHEGRGIGLPAKIHAYKLQESGLDTVEANLRLGFPAELREYGVGAQILVDLGIHKMRLLTNNPKKVIGLEGYGLEIVERLPINADPNPHNEKYLDTKRDKMGHLL